MQIVAEIGLQHCGCLGTAFAFIDAVADAGVDVAKFQNHCQDTCKSFRPGMENYFPQDDDREDYWDRTSFGHAHWPKLRDKCHKRGLKFSCSVFSLQGVEMMSTIVDTFKVPSSKTNDLELLKAVAATGKPVVISTGMSDRKETAEAVYALHDAGCKPTILECSSVYPCTPEMTLLSQNGFWWNIECPAGYERPWGLSDHSGSIIPGLIAAWQGADMLELHCCWSRQQWGPDVSSSLTIDELKQLVDGVRFVERMRASTITKDQLAAELEPVRRVFRGA